MSVNTDMAANIHVRMSATQPEHSVEQDKKRKRGVRHDDSYFRNIVKRKRLTGSAYTNYGGKYVTERKIGPPCR